MIIGTAFTLFVVPAVYMLVAHAQERVAVRKQAALAPEAEPATVAA